MRVKACGVCRSDWHAWTGADFDVSAPHVPGHEFAGVVEDVGKECQRFKAGDRVTAPFILACGACPDCLGGDATVCNHQFVVGFSGWGAFAERIAVPRADFNLVPLPDAMDFAEAAGMGCRVTTSFRALVDRAKLQPGEWLAVHGCGGVGLSAVMIGAAIGAQVLAIDVNEEALHLAKSLGAGASINARAAGDVGQATRDITGGGAHVSVDALGITETSTTRSGACASWAAMYRSACRWAAMPSHRCRCWNSSIPGRSASWAHGAFPPAAFRRCSR